MHPHQHHNIPGLEYLMTADYEPNNDSRCIRCRENDLIFVQKPFVFHFMGTETKPEGWLYGRNLRTSETGYIPAEYVTFMQEIRTSSIRGRPVPPNEGLPTVIEEHSGNDNSSAPQIPPRRPPDLYVPVTLPNLSMPSPVHDNANLSLQDQEWYWKNVSRDEAKARLSDEPDGTFLVRNSFNNPNEYTLTLCKGGNIKLIRICYRNGMYGFAEPCTFPSVVQLINHHKKETLKRYNPELDITLKYAAAPFENDEPLPLETMEELWKSLRITDQSYVQLCNMYQETYDRVTEKQQAIQTNKTAIKAYDETIKMFKDQCGTLNGFLEQARGKHDEHRLIDNFRTMQTRLRYIVNQCEELRRQLNADMCDFKDLDLELNNYKAQMSEARKLRDDKIAFMKSRKMTDEQINSHLQLDDGEEDDDEPHRFYHMEPVDLQRKYPEHCIVNNWYFPSSGRLEVDRMLQGLADGTFLIRERADLSTAPNAPYACSLVANGAVHHCLIERTPDGYGFAEPFNLHPTLKDLVLHYAHNSLIPHNDTLDTTLRVPYRCARR